MTPPVALGVPEDVTAGQRPDHRGSASTCVGSTRVEPSSSTTTREAPVDGSISTSRRRRPSRSLMSMNARPASADHQVRPIVTSEKYGMGKGSMSTGSTVRRSTSMITTFAIGCAASPTRG